jgi:hypothetical protein
VIDSNNGSSRVANYIACHEWFVFGGSNEKGKQNDWIFHNASIDYILRYYSKEKSRIKIWDIWTDNCPTQVSPKMKNLLLLLVESCEKVKRRYHYYGEQVKANILLLLLPPSVSGAGQ